MTKRIAVIPLKPEIHRKSRLGTRLTAEVRVRLSMAMFARVTHALLSSGVIDEMFLLAVERPEGWEGEWIRDQGRGLNVELMEARARTIPASVLVVHADLPCVEADDISALNSCCEQYGIGLAPDRHGTGTNAVALKRGVGFDFGFGSESLVHHRAQCKSEMSLIRRPGLMLDCDTPDDLDIAISAGFSFPN